VEDAHLGSLQVSDWNSRRDRFTDPRTLAEMFARHAIYRVAASRYVSKPSRYLRARSLATGSQLPEAEDNPVNSTYRNQRHPSIIEGRKQSSASHERIAQNMIQGQEFWRGVPIWKDLSADDFLSYEWSVSVDGAAVAVCAAVDADVL
jgi:hypothetical protein